MTMNCPCCGQTGCPVGTAGAGLLGMIVAFILQRKPKTVLRNDNQTEDLDLSERAFNDTLY